MKGKYDYNPIEKLYLLLHNELLNHISPGAAIIEREYKDIDNIFKLIMLNNGCKISEDVIPKQTYADIIQNEYQVCFITGMIGNDANEYYDFLIFNGVKILVIFLDYFNDILTYRNIPSESDPLYQLKISMGNSVYYDAIKKIVEVFYLTSEPMPGGLLTTAMVTTQRWNQAIIAINIINTYKPVDENDISDMPIDEVKKILDGKIELQLYGIRTM